MRTRWEVKAVEFLHSMQVAAKGGARSTPNGPQTLYGTCYSHMGLYYLGLNSLANENFFRFVIETQDLNTGLLIGPELLGFQGAPGVMHDREHLLLHSTCATIPICQQYSFALPIPVRFAHQFCDAPYLKTWMRARNWENAWFEGNNILFVGQLLVYLRDVEDHPGAQASLDAWFDWLDREIDPQTSLWGTNGFCGAADAVYGGYHQLLVYWHENRPIRNPYGLVDTVLSLRHWDGGFNPNGNAGACEDVDCVDILVNCYKRWDYRRAEIRRALRYCVDHILATQNPDGGFPYNRDCPQSHMGIPGTEAGPNVSCTFPTWFRIHTLALCHEIIPEHPQLSGIPFRFSKFLSMGWHQSPPGWNLSISEAQRREEELVDKHFHRRKQIGNLRTRATQIRNLARRVKSKAGNITRGIKRRLQR